MQDGAAPRVRDLLEEAILEGELKPGERLRAEALAQRFGTSRTPIREALLQLEAQGLVEVEPNRGAVVRTFDRDDLRDLYEVRALLEPHAAARAAHAHHARDDIERLDALCDDATVEQQIVANEAVPPDHPRGGAAARGWSVAMRAASGIPRAFRSRVLARRAPAGRVADLPPPPRQRVPRPRRRSSPRP